MRLLIRYILIVIVSVCANAQTVQKGIVKEYNEKAQKTPLAGVEFDISSANSTVSDKDGGFNLNFLMLKAGDRVPFRNNGREIRKNGYDNKD